MAFDQATRNRLQKFVSETKSLLSDEFTRQFQNDYGMDPDTGTVSDIENLPHLTDAELQTAKLLRETMGHYQTSSPGSDEKEILSRIVREQAFTVLNRLCALRMAEARGILIESISKGYNSKGFQLYARVANASLGESGDTYRNYLFSVFDEFAMDLAVLFDRYSPMGRLFPKESVLLELLDQINDVEIETLWAEDETIGWIYQYFNSKEERKKMRDESSAPRNSRELAVRNQFFTPRYVVEFLTDNTLGRIWYEMTRGDTRLKDQCRYLVRRPHEIFLKMGEKAPEQKDDDADLTQEELLNQPVHIEHRPVKDPREILMLDPACGSMHFGLYAFDLFEKIYEEAWDLQASGKWPGDDSENFRLISETYTTKEALLKDIPRLIIENNIHGVDIDPRAVQIAGLSLWLRAQRSWKEQNIKPNSRPQIRKSNIVCAEPMPGEKEFLQDFADHMKPRVLGQLVEIIFEKMELAGEAGSLLKIEEEIEEALEKAREEFNKEVLRRKEESGYFPGMAPKNRERSLFDFVDLPDKTQFWQTAEERILEALRNYAEKAEAEDGIQLRLFVEDASKGLAFIDLCRKRYDVVLMNPPFGNYPKKLVGITKFHYKAGWIDLYSCFVIRTQTLLVEDGFCGCITSRTFLHMRRLANFRKGIFLNIVYPYMILDLGSYVLDSAAVETCASVFSKYLHYQYSHFIDLRETKNKERRLSEIIHSEGLGHLSSQKTEIFLRNPNDFSILPDSIYAYRVPKNIALLFKELPSLDKNIAKANPGLTTLDNERFLRLNWEVPLSNNDWVSFVKGGDGPKFYQEVWLCLDWNKNGKSLKVKAESYGGSASRFIASESKYFHPGLTYPRVSKDLSVRILPEGCIFAEKGISIFLIANDIDKNETSKRLLTLLALLSSKFAENLVALSSPGRFWESGSINRLPVFEKLFSQNLDSLAMEGYKHAKAIFVMNENSRFFVHPFHDSSDSRYDEILGRINQIIKTQYGIESECDFACVNKSNVAFTTNPSSDNISYCFGTIFGRWNVLCSMNQNQKTETFDPFASLPPCPPGMLQNANGLPAEPKDVPADYPLRISWSGIIIGDEGHPEDIITRIREAIEVIWKDKANEIEQEACEILGVHTIREYFSKPGKFFAAHLKRYSKSRRQAPIYWPLSTPSGSYTLWLYCHRLTDQTLYTCVNNFVGPKIKQVSDDADNLRKKSNRTRQEEKELEKLSDLAEELKDFDDELLRIAKFWKPNLNDGVQITAAPLWKLFQHKPWQKKLKQTWKDLEKGKYDWAHLAYSIWQERVIRASHKDRSYAIAHDLEDDLWEEIETGKGRKGNPKTKWVPKELSENELKELIAQKTEGRV